MTSFDYELQYLKAGAVELEAYLLSAELYWPIGIRVSRRQKAYPRLTLGILSIARVKASVLAASPAQKDAFEDVADQITAAQNQWRSAWGRKASSEYRSRINLWRNFLDDYRQHPASHFDRYGYEVERRALLQLLADDADEVRGREDLLLDSLDQYLKAIIVPGGFIWDTDLEPGFPQDPYWYLYGLLRE